MLEFALDRLTGAEGPQVERARARVTAALGKLEEDRAASRALEELCGRAPSFGPRYIAGYLRTVANDPKGIEVERCDPPELTQDCWRLRCDFSFTNAFGARMRQTANFYVRDNNIESTDAF